MKKTLRAGDLVEILPPDQIAATLDSTGCLDSLPFMPEMAQLCGQQFRIARRSEKTCHDVPDGDAREFFGNDVVQLAEVRCTGEYHNGCDRQCRMFWKESWLRKVLEESQASPQAAEAVVALTKKLVTIGDDGLYFCQSSQLGKATRSLSTWQTLLKCHRDVKSGNRSFIEMTRVFAWTSAWKCCAKLFGKRRGGSCTRTPDEALDLQPGETVEVKSFGEILATLDKKGCNRGLSFESDMREHCGKTFRVDRRLEKMICEDSGRMIKVKNTVMLAGVTCGCYCSWGGCSRAEPMYWREIWLKRT